MNVKRLFKNLSRIFNNDFMVFALMALMVPFFNANAKKDEETLTATPILTSRCKALINSRSKKIGLKQKAANLKKRASTLNSNLSPNAKSKKKKIELVERKIDLKIQLLSKEISYLEEDIIRKGCPSIKL